MVKMGLISIEDIKSSFTSFSFMLISLLLFLRKPMKMFIIIFMCETCCRSLLCVLLIFSLKALPLPNDQIEFNNLYV